MFSSFVSVCAQVYSKYLPVDGWKGMQLLQEKIHVDRTVWDLEMLRLEYQ